MKLLVVLFLIVSTVAGGGRAADLAGHRQPVEQASAVVRVTNTLSNLGFANVGTGVVVHDDGQRAIVLSCWHTFREGVGTVSVCSGGRCYQAKVLKQDKESDLSALELPSVGVPAVGLGEPANQGDRVSAYGLGQAGQLRRISGVVKGFTPDRHGHLVVVGRNESGDSGGPVLDSRRELVGIMWGGDHSEILAASLPRIRELLRGVLPRDWRPVVLPGPGDAASRPLVPVTQEPPARAAPAADSSTPPTGSGTGSQVAAESTPELLAPARPAAVPGGRPSTPAADSGAISQPVTPPLIRSTSPVDSAAGDETPDAAEWDLLGPTISTAQAIAPVVLAVLAAAGITIPPLGLGVWGVRILSAIARRRRRRRKEGQAEEAKPFSTVPRDTTEAEQFLQLSTDEGRAAVLDALVGRLTFDAIDETIDGSADESEKSFARRLKDRLLTQFNEMAPVAVYDTTQETEE